MVGSSQGTATLRILKILKREWGGAQVEHWPSVHETLGSIPITTKRKKYVCAVEESTQLWNVEFVPGDSFCHWRLWGWWWLKPHIPDAFPIDTWRWPFLSLTLILKDLSLPILVCNSSHTLWVSQCPYTWRGIDKTEIITRELWELKPFYHLSLFTRTDIEFVLRFLDLVRIENWNLA